MKKLIGCIFSCMVTCILGGCSLQADSIGIIGGADGPTAIFITSKINWLEILGRIVVVMIAVGAAVMVYRSKKKE